MPHPSLPFATPASLPVRSSLVTLLLASAAALPVSATAATLCVDQHGKAGCYNTISAAVAAAAAGDTIKVHPGIYHEDVVITSSLSLLGTDRDSTVIDATGLSNGIFINGFDNAATGFASLDEVTVTGFTVRNANFEGILANYASHAVIWGNSVLNNDQALRAGSACLGLPPFETGESADCGGGIHLIGVVHTTVSDNLVTGNAGGIVLSDETTTTHDNVIARNLVEGNKSSAGLTLASFPAYSAPDQPGTPVVANGLYNNLAAHNLLLKNGGAGAAILAPGSGNRAYANSLVSNRILGNAAAGVEIHAGASTLAGVKDGDASRNTVFGNYIAQNGGDPYASTHMATGISISGPAAVVDTLMTGNVIEAEAIGVAFNSNSTLEMHLNDLIVGRNLGVANQSASGTVNATENWWGCPQGPGAAACATVTGAVTYSPFLAWPADSTGGHGHDLLFNVLPSYVPLLAWDLHALGFDF